LNSCFWSFSENSQVCRRISQIHIDIVLTWCWTFFWSDPICFSFYCRPKCSKFYALGLGQCAILLNFN
jgi:hypothetical protein